MQETLLEWLEWKAREFLEFIFIYLFLVQTQIHSFFCYLSLCPPIEKCVSYLPILPVQALPKWQ